MIDSNFSRSLRLTKNYHELDCIIMYKTLIISTFKSSLLLLYVHSVYNVIRMIQITNFE